MNDSPHGNLFFEAFTPAGRFVFSKAWVDCRFLPRIGDTMRLDADIEPSLKVVDVCWSYSSSLDYVEITLEALGTGDEVLWGRWEKTLKDHGWMGILIEGKKDENG